MVSSLCHVSSCASSFHVSFPVSFCYSPLVSDSHFCLCSSALVHCYDCLHCPDLFHLFSVPPASLVYMLYVFVCSQSPVSVCLCTSMSGVPDFFPSLFFMLLVLIFALPSGLCLCLLYVRFVCCVPDWFCLCTFHQRRKFYKFIEIFLNIILNIGLEVTKHVSI